MLTFNSVTYQVNVVSDASNATDAFAPENGVMVRKVFANTPANLKFPDGSYMPAGTVFTNTLDTTKTFTLTNGDGYMTGQAVGNYTTTLGGSETVYLKVSKSATPDTPDYVIRDVAIGKDAFVYEHITLAGQTGNLKLTKFTDGGTPTAVNQISSDSNGVFYLTEDVVGGNYGAYFNQDTPNR